MNETSSRKTSSRSFSRFTWEKDMLRQSSEETLIRGPKGSRILGRPDSWRGKITSLRSIITRVSSGVEQFPTYTTQHSTHLTIHQLPHSPKLIVHLISPFLLSLVTGTANHGKPTTSNEAVHDPQSLPAAVAQRYTSEYANSYYCCSASE